MSLPDTVKDTDELNSPDMVEARRRAVRDFNALPPEQQARCDFNRMVARHHAAILRRRERDRRAR